MIGILLALQVNNWNEHRKDRIKEQQVLRELHSEFLTNKAKIQEQNNRIKENMTFHRSYIQALGRGNVSMKMIGKFNGGSKITVGTINPSFGAINSLISTGDIALITNDSLRKKLSNWKDVLLDFTEDEEIHLNYFLNHIVPYIRTNFLQYMSKGKVLSFHDLSQEEIEKDFQENTGKKRYRNIVINNLDWIEGNLEGGEETLKKLEEILSLIEKEIK